MTELRREVRCQRRRDRLVRTVRQLSTTGALGSPRRARSALHDGRARRESTFAPLAEAANREVSTGHERHEPEARKPQRAAAGAAQEEAPDQRSDARSHAPRHAIVSRHGRGVDDEQRQIAGARREAGQDRGDREAQVGDPVEVFIGTLAIGGRHDVGDHRGDGGAIHLGEPPHRERRHADLRNRRREADREDRRGAAEEREQHGRAPAEAVGERAPDQAREDGSPP